VAFLSNRKFREISLFHDFSFSKSRICADFANAIILIINVIAIFPSLEQVLNKPCFNFANDDLMIADPK
jgi:hypothetical protein